MRGRPQLLTEVRCEHGANDVLASLVRRGDSLERLGEGLALQVLVGRELRALATARQRGGDGSVNGPVGGCCAGQSCSNSGGGSDAMETNFTCAVTATLAASASSVCWAARKFSSFCTTKSSFLTMSALSMYWSSIDLASASIESSSA